jgi:anti-sigma-K factor RskA
MNCEELRDQYELYVLGVADETEASEILAHLNRKCETCAAGVNDARALSAMLATSAPDASPRPELRNRILAAAGATLPTPAPTQSKSQWAGVWVWAWAAAACMAGATAVYFEMRQGQTESQLANVQARLDQTAAESSRRATQLARLNEAMAIVNSGDTVEVSFGPGKPKPANGKVFVHEKGVLLVASSLPVAPQGKTYEMWIIPRTGSPAPAGLFQSAADGTAMNFQPGPIDIAATGAVAVTIENAGGAPQPTSTPLIVAALMPPRPAR